MVLEKVKMILSNQFDVEEDSITPETNIADDLGADSLDVVDMLMSLEDEFDVEIPDEGDRENAHGGRSGFVHRGAYVSFLRCLRQIREKEPAAARVEPRPVLLVIGKSDELRTYLAIKSTTITYIRGWISLILPEAILTIT